MSLLSSVNSSGALICQANVGNGYAGVTGCNIGAGSHNFIAIATDGTNCAWERFDYFVPWPTPTAGSALFTLNAPTWGAGVNYPLGANGAPTVIVDSNGHLQQVITPGVSNSVSAPSWGTTVGAITTETSGLQWQLMTLSGNYTTYTSFLTAYATDKNNTLTGGIRSPRSGALFLIYGGSNVYANPLNTDLYLPFVMKVIGVPQSGLLPLFQCSPGAGVATAQGIFSGFFDTVFEGLEATGANDVSGNSNWAAFYIVGTSFGGKYVTCCHAYNNDTGLLAGTYWGTAALGNSLFERNGTSSDTSAPLEQAYFFPFPLVTVQNLTSIGDNGSHELKMRGRMSILSNVKTYDGNETTAVFGLDVPTGQLFVCDSLTTQHGPNFNGNPNQISLWEEELQQYYAPEAWFGTLNAINDCFQSTYVQSILYNGQLTAGRGPQSSFNIGVLNTCIPVVSAEINVVSVKNVPSNLTSIIPTSGPGAGLINVTTPNVIPPSSRGTLTWEDYSPPPLLAAKGTLRTGNSVLGAKSGDVLLRRRREQ